MIWKAKYFNDITYQQKKFQGDEKISKEMGHFHAELVH